VIAAVTANSALEAARQIAPFLKAHHMYVDINSVSPSAQAGNRRRHTTNRSRVRRSRRHGSGPAIWSSSPHALGWKRRSPVLRTMSPFGMRLEVLDGKVGAAAAVKMCRSIVVKGLEALLFECVLGASRYDADDRVFASLNESFSGNRLERNSQIT